MQSDASLKVLFAASECFPLIKTGGLADVVGALPLALGHRGCDTRVLVPGFPSVLAAAQNKKSIGQLVDITGGTVTLHSAKSKNGLNLIIAKADHLFGIDGNPYLAPNGQDRPDNAMRYAAFAKIVADVAAGGMPSWQADVVHLHDWQTGLAAAYVKNAQAAIKTVFTIHNLAFQGLFPKEFMSKTGLPKSMFDRDGLEYWDQISFLKAGVMYADHVTTVSPAYAREIQTDDGGMGFGGLLKSRSDTLSGIANGIDTEVWDPETDSALEMPYSARKPAGKATNKRALQSRFNLSKNAKGPLMCVVSRLTEQKGLDLVADALPHIIGNGAQLVVVGSGDKQLENRFLEAAKQHPGAVGTFIGYDENLAHLTQAGSDAILVPSRFEPCGLTQLCGLRYGTLPVVGRVGGLADTVIDANDAALHLGLGTGIQFNPVNIDGFQGALDRCFELYTNTKLWRKVQKNAMKSDVGWARPATIYLDIYTHL